jgi:putative endonuclease
MSGNDQTWSLYLLDCDGRLYTGISTDPARRYREHLAGGARGARFTRAAKQVSLLWHAKIGTHGDALRAEHRLRKLPRARKLAIISAHMDGPAIRALLLQQGQ